MAQLLVTTTQSTQDSVPRTLLRRRGTIYLPAPTGGHATDTDGGLRLLEADLIDRGWLLGPALRNELSQLADVDLVGVGVALLANCDALVGADQPHVPLFRNFPISTAANTYRFFVDRVLSLWFQWPDQPCVLCEADDTVQPVNPCGHLVCSACFDGADFAACPICHRRIDVDDPYLRSASERPKAISGAMPERLRVLHLGRDADADVRVELTTLLARPTTLSPADVADLKLLLDARPRDDLSFIPSTVPGRDTKAYLLGWLLAGGPTPRILDVCGSHLDTATDVLRLLVVLSGGEPGLRERPRFAAIPRPLRRAVLSWLDRIGLTQLVEDMRRNERMWIRAGERLHPGEFEAVFPTTFLAFAALRRTPMFAMQDRSVTDHGARLVASRIVVPSLGSEVEERIGRHETAEAAALLAARRPGELVRRLDHLLRLNAQQTTAVLESFRGVVHRVAPAVLLSALGQLRTRTAKGDVRAFFPASTASVAHVIPDERPIPPQQAVAAVIAILQAELLRRAALLPHLDRAVIDRGLDGIMVPFAQRTAARVLVTLARGSVLPLTVGRYLRLFCHWMETPDQRVDLDLSLALFDAGWNHVGTCDYTHLRVAGDGAVHSGDLTSAPKPLGASEFVDLDLDILATQARYAVMVIFSYNSVPFGELAQAFAGWMLRADPGTHGPVFDPRSVEQRFDLAGPSKSTLPMVVDIAERTVRWLDVAPRVTGDNHAVHRHHAQLATVASALVDSFARGSRVTVGEVARIHAAARTDEVIVRDPKCRDGFAVFRRGRLEDVASFAGRIADGRDRDATAAPDATASAGLQLLMRGDLAAPPGAEVYALHGAALNTSDVRLRSAVDFVADLAPST